MDTEEAVVEKTAPQKAWVRVQQNKACANCSSAGACHIAESKSQILIEVANDLDARTGDRVEIRMPEGSLLKLSLLVYFSPIAALLAGAFLSHHLAAYLLMDETFFSIIGGLAAMAAAFYALKRIDSGRTSWKKYAPRITRILSRP